MSSLILALLIAVPLTLDAWPLTLSASEQDDKATQFAAAMQQGERALALHQYEDALSAFKRANGLRDKQSADAHYAMARTYRELKAFKSAADSCTNALKYVGDNKELEVAIRNVRGLSTFALVEKNDDKRLKDAEADFRAILQMTDALPIVRYNLGFSLVRQGRDDEGIAELKEYIARAGSTREAAEAKRIIENPRRARVVFAPDFSFTTLDGEYISLEDLRGRVVLLDFWATWCGPCVASTPGLVRLQKKYAEAPVTIVGVSLDRSRDAWKNYVEKNRMMWPQYLDNGRVARLFDIKPIPTYIIIDHEGVVRATRTGYGSGTDGWLDDEIRKALKDAQKETQR